MKFAGIIKSSFVDYPKKVVATIFTGGCNFRCEYCHNGVLIEPKDVDLYLTEDEIIKFLKKRKNVLDGLCITGGEPTLWNGELVNFIRKIKLELGEKFLIKIDTNGSNPKFIYDNKKLIDFFAMDFKSLNYNKFSKINLDTIKESLKQLESTKDYEVRITMYPNYIKEEDFNKIAEILKDVKKIAIQQFNNKEVYMDKNMEPYKKEVLYKLKTEIENRGVLVEIRGE
ncbi:anaerobic ribonucleoside-triphosphate reductase activating protein [Haliovirga abyssi]|uniref:Anaerobic ribonucleoside-triphosphate reductase activating protein n=1 Tax=Haliovirga abyssi TaxID=2996794 RepID=A0AAU9DX95_9FUSO|nr:anaerobic ribonucleoside-triphosphate reductase activating protein [Haliovirga abyssi]BDU49970.1 anaerobic ribonucleoside-triphosphate reductase activating protein [Haliovirga abyssi]